MNVTGRVASEELPSLLVDRSLTEYSVFADRPVSVKSVTDVEIYDAFVQVLSPASLYCNTEPEIVESESIIHVTVALLVVMLVTSTLYGIGRAV